MESIQDFAGKFLGLKILAGLLQIGRWQVISYDRFSGLILIFFDLDFSRNFADDKPAIQKNFSARASAKRKGLKSWQANVGLAGRHLR